MAFTYYQGNTIDATLGTGADFNKALITTPTTAASQTMAIAGLATEISFGAGPANSGANAINGTWTVLVRVTTAAATQTVAVAIDRYNSANVSQVQGTLTAAQTINAVATYTFNPVVSAGTWLSTDRIRVRYQFVSTNMTGVSSVIEMNTALSAITIPDPFVPPIIVNPQRQEYVYY